MEADTRERRAHGLNNSKGRVSKEIRSATFQSSLVSGPETMNLFLLRGALRRNPSRCDRWRRGQEKNPNVVSGKT